MDITGTTNNDEPKFKPAPTYTLELSVKFDAADDHELAMRSLYVLSIASALIANDPAYPMYRTVTLLGVDVGRVRLRRVTE